MPGLKQAQSPEEAPERPFSIRTSSSQCRRSRATGPTLAATPQTAPWTTQAPAATVATVFSKQSFRLVEWLAPLRGCPEKRPRTRRGQRSASTPMSGSPGWAAVAGAAADKTLPKTPIPKPQRHLELQFRRLMRLLTLTSYPCQPLSPENPAPLRNPKYTRETGRATPIHQLGIERLSFEDIFMGN